MMDVLRLRVADLRRDNRAGVEFAVEIYINDREVTSRSAGLGMDPYELLVPGGRLAGGGEPVRVGIARCGCGIYGCDWADVIITRDENSVRWSWLSRRRTRVPFKRDCVFDARQYDEEVRRAEQDTSWETLDRSVARALWDGFPDGALREGFRLRSVYPSLEAPDDLDVGLTYGDAHTVDVLVAWEQLSAPEMTRRVLDVIAHQPLVNWRATWSSSTRGSARPPEFPESWRRRIW